MLALYVWPQPKLLHQAQDTLGLDLQHPRQDLTTVDPERLAALCEQARRESGGGKLAIMVLNGSHLRHQLPRLEDWPLDAEVCTPQWWRMHNQWQASPRIGGSLTIAATEGR